MPLNATDSTRRPGLIRSVTLLAYLDTPWRFKRKTKLWKYCGVGLQRATSGQDRHGREHPAQLELVWPEVDSCGLCVGAARQEFRPFGPEHLSLWANSMEVCFAHRWPSAIRRVGPCDGTIGSRRSDA